MIVVDCMALSDAQLDAVLDQYDSPNETLSTDYLVRNLKRDPYHYSAPERIVRDAINDGYLYVDSVDRKGVVFLGLTDTGEHEWEELVENESQEDENE